MVTMLDCINRFQEKIQPIIDTREENYKPIFDMVKDDLSNINQIILVGSGTSNTSATTARGFIEKVTNIQTICILANEFLYNYYAYNPKALYVFTSQTGSSYLTLDAVRKMREKGYYTVGLTEGMHTTLAKEVQAHVDLNCGYEEYGMRTLGYCCSVLTLMVMGLEIARKLNRIDEETYQNYLQEAMAVKESHKTNTANAMKWFDKNKEQLMNSDTFTIYGDQSLFGVALEAAIKILELSKRKIAAGYEMDDGMHGPTMGYTFRNCTIVLNSGGKKDNRTALAKWAKNEIHNGFMVGENCIDEKDFAFTPVTKDFMCLEFAPFVQVLGYRLAIDNGVDLLDLERHKEFKYFSVHDEDWNRVEEQA